MNNQKKFDGVLAERKNGTIRAIYSSERPEVRIEVGQPVREKFVNHNKEGTVRSIANESDCFEIHVEYLGFPLFMRKIHVNCVHDIRSLLTN